MEDEHGLSREEREKSMQNSTADGVAYSVMSGAGDAFVPAAVISLGATNFYIGLLAALPQLAGALLQFFSLAAMRWCGSRKLLVIGGATVHALSWLSIIAILLWPNAISVELIIAFFSLGSAASMMANPAWSSWISDIVPENERSRFFANRNRLMQLGLFAATFIAGLALRQLQLNYPAGIAFACVFAIALLARTASAYFHTKVKDVKYEVQLLREIKLKHLFLLPAHRNELWFLGFVGLMDFAALFAAPFFTPYMINELHYDLGMLGLMTAVSVLAKVLSFGYWGKAADRFGNRAVLIATAFMVPLVPIMWLFSKDAVMIALFQVFSGFVWAGFDLASFNHALALVSRELRPSFISKYNAFTGLFNAAGALAGGLFLSLAGNWAVAGYSGILLLFLISGALRIAVTIAFAPRIAGPKLQNTADERTMVLNLIAVYPTQGAIGHALGGWNFTRKVVAEGTAKSERAIAFGLGATGELIAEGGRKIASKMVRKKRL